MSAQDSPQDWVAHYGTAAKAANGKPKPTPANIKKWRERRKKKQRKKILKALEKKQKNQRKKWRATIRKADDGFYKSEGWREVRFAALKRADGCCTLCGRSKRMHDVVLHVDHIKPRSRFPHLSLDPSNLQVLCEDCNIGKSNRDTTDWRGENVVQIIWDDEEPSANHPRGRGA